MTAQAAPTASTPLPEAPPTDAPVADAAVPERRRKRFARWRPRTALAVVILALIGSQLVALALVLAAGGSDGLDWVAASGLVVADIFLVGVVVAFARRGAEKLGAATFGIRRTAFWPAV